MLILNRYPGQGIVLRTPAGDVTVTILDPRPGQRYRVGIDAPPEIKIIRKELEPNPPAAPDTS